MVPLLVQAALKDVEKVVTGSTTFRVCRLFTLDRHIILSVSGPHPRACDARAGSVLNPMFPMHVIG